MRYVFIKLLDAINFEVVNFAYLHYVKCVHDASVVIKQYDGILEFLHLPAGFTYTGENYDKIFYYLTSERFNRATSDPDFINNDVVIYDLDKTPGENYVYLSDSEWFTQLAFDEFLQTHNGVK